jgi:hypothetical protein
MPVLTLLTMLTITVDGATINNAAGGLRTALLFWRKVLITPSSYSLPDVTCCHRLQATDSAAV